METTAAVFDNGAELTDSVNLMNEIMRRKLSLLHEMHYLTVQAYSYVSEESVESLGNIFETKQGLIREIDGLDKQFLALFDGLKAGFGINSMAELRQDRSPGLKDLRANTSEILEMLKKLDALDAKLNQSVEKLRGNVAADLNRIRKQRQISGVYSSDSVRRDKKDQPDMTSHPNFDIKK